MSNKKPERSESGAPIYRHQARQRDFRVSAQDPDSLERIEAHIAQYVGQPATVFHEIVSDVVHVDIHIVEPSPSRDYYTLVTTGMSDRPMKTPAQAEGLEYAELLICLPPSWLMSEKAWKQEENYWPVRWLKTLARLPHEYDTWLWAGHTVPNGDPPRRYASNTNLCCALLATPVLFGDPFRKLAVRDGKTVYFHSFLPIYREEVDLKLTSGTNALFDLLGDAGVTELLDVQRPNVAKKGKGLLR